VDAAGAISNDRAKPNAEAGRFRGSPAMNVALRTGRIAVGRLNDAVYHVLALNFQLGLLKL